MKLKLIISLTVILSLPTAANTFICSDNIDKKPLCDATQEIKKKINSAKFSGEMSPILHKKLYVKNAVLINDKLTLSTLFSPGITSKKLSDKDYKKAFLQKTFKKVCQNGSIYNNYVKKGGKITIKFSYEQGGYRNLPSDMHIKDCKNPPFFG